MSTNQTKLLTRPAAADRLASCLRVVDEQIANGNLPIVRIGRSVRISEAALEEFIEARTVRVRPPDLRKRVWKRPVIEQRSPA
ncbi:MAG: excisionase family DNA-binding protein [Akkermansiaceae bacterium]|nr:excisionase family DNA-binding protein [Akkermansiaceae bacterium]